MACRSSSSMHLQIFLNKIARPTPPQTKQKSKCAWVPAPPFGIQGGTEDITLFALLKKKMHVPHPTLLHLFSIHHCRFVFFGTEDNQALALSAQEARLAWEQLLMSCHERCSLHLSVECAGQYVLARRLQNSLSYLWLYDEVLQDVLLDSRYVVF